MKRYDSYKDSGVEWIGEIPSHWTKSKLKFVSEIITGNTPPTKDEDNYEGGEYLWVKPNEINGLTPTNDTNQKLTEKGKSLSRVLPPFSVLVNGIGRIGEFGYSEMSVSTNQQINSIVYNHKVDKRYGLFHTSMMKEGFISNSEKVVVPILNKTKQENIEFIIPPLSEQQQIVSFLDTKTSLIDSLIEKTLQKIKLLKEKRTSLINEVVTKGLNPNVEMKDSGVEWVGEIPSHWEKISLGKLGVLYGGLTGKSGDDFRSDDHPSNKPFIPFTNIFNNTYISKDHFQSVVVGDDENQNRVEKFDLFFLMSSEDYDDLGKSSILIEDVGELYLNSFCKGFRINRNDVYPLFLNYQLLGDTHKNLISIEGNGFTRINLRQDRLKETPMFIPPISEQQEIVEYLDEQTQKIDKTISIEEKRIELLKEYRQSLISESVTGKLKVVES